MPQLSVRSCAIAIAIGALSTSACGRSREQSPAKNAPEATRHAHLDVEPYPRGSWRIDPSRLNVVRLGLAHILIGYAGAKRFDPNVPFVAEAADRSREEALRVALGLERELDRKPAEFQRLALRSDDRTSRDGGGDLGVVAVAGLPSTMLDALAAIGVGLHSRVIETEFGFHIVKRLSVPAERRIALRRILIQHREVPDSLRAAAVIRTRAEAVALAKQLRSTLQAAPDRFAELARLHSDASDAAAGGAIGLVSTHDGAEHALGVKWLAQAQEGAIGEPVESLLGFQIYQRVAGSESEQLVASFIHIGSSLPADGANGEADRAELARLAKRLATELAREPARFAAEQQRLCTSLGGCSDQQWTLERGRHEARQVDLVASLRIGQVAAEPFSDGQGFFIVRREEPQPAATQERYEIEMPEVPFASFEEHLPLLDGDALSHGTLELLKVARGRLGLDAQQQEALSALYNELARELRTAPPAQRAALIAQHQAKVLALVGSEKMAVLHRLREAQWRNAQLM